MEGKRRAVFMIPAALGHFNPTRPIARLLEDRGFLIEYLTNAEFGPEILRHGFSFLPHPETAIPFGDAADFFDLQSRRVGLDVLRGVIVQLRKILPPIAESALEQLTAHRPDILITDDYRTVCGAVVAQHLGVPWASIIVTPIRQPDRRVPPAGSGLGPPRSSRERWRHVAIRWYFRRLYAPLVRTHRELTERHHLKRAVVRNHWLSPDLTLCLTTKEFEFPRRREIKGLQYVGPCIDVRRPTSPFPPLVRAKGRRIAFISLGTINNNHPRFFHGAIRACLAVDPEMFVIASIGERLSVSEFENYSENVAVVPFAPQLEVLEQATLMISHGGMNSVSEALYFGVPLVVFPVGADQPDVAARVEHCGAGVRGDVREHDAEALRKPIERVWREPAFRANADRIRDAYRRAGGARRAADLLTRLAETA